ncbi:Histone deacetylase complex, catalytic component RPD3 [Handroanthus impetiginosus]|uniref:histone deacetylase n=1 Tax=Handroanthus impetiginosus TaxID=429701 RepID=A0A2G9G7H0_9LAMI|nr:Histone deacetylase complex, catalytic component RPD3 [Handroanthus impetiginosus]
MEFSGGSGSSLSRRNDIVSPRKRRVGLIYDGRMRKHYEPDYEDDHPECPDRIEVIWKRLNSSGLAKRCVILNAKAAENNHLARVHTKKHIDLIKNISSHNESRRKRIAKQFNSIYFNEGSTEAAYLAAGSVIEVADKVAKGELDSAFAIVRPPGHHAEEDSPMGFCLYNNVAVATSYLLNERKELGINRILIVDWDVHHGNGTQKMFYKDRQVLFFSVHRYDNGSFYPATDDADYVMTGEGPGAGYNINVPWGNGRCGDADYLAVWDHILIPVAKEFNPDMIIISAGFDAAIGDPLGGCRVSPYGYSIMLAKLMEFAGGKIVMALEGGYNLNSIAYSVQACVDVLLQEKPVIGSLEAYPFASTWLVIEEVRQALSMYWPVLSAKLPENVTGRTSQIEISSLDSDSEHENLSLPILEEVQNIEDVIQPFKNLKVNEDRQDQEATAASPSWRSELSKIYIWYATFGSNLRMSRFRCYIEGGQTEGMRKPCMGSMDKNMPTEIMWKTFPHRLFFARALTATWGPGGVAFLHPERNVQEKTYMCLYKITLEQFNDVLLQENVPSYDMSRPLFDMTALQNIQIEKCISVELVQRGWYHNVVYLGKENNIPILTMTCTLSDVESFISGKFPINPPCKEYASTLVKGLVEGKQLSEEEALAYIREASTKPLAGDGL